MGLLRQFLSATVSGKAYTTQKQLFVENPAFAQVFASCPDFGPADVDASVKSAKEAAHSWQHSSIKEREAVLDAIGAALRENEESIASLLTDEQGKPIDSARREVKSALTRVLDVKTVDLSPRIIREGQSYIEISRKPLGVVGVITPWNFPVSTAMGRVASAIWAGNAAILKPSPFTPLSSLYLGEVLRGALPPGLFNIISGGDQAGIHLSSHPDVAKINLTGSVRAGQSVAGEIARSMKRVTLELGGNDPAIVLEDAPIAEIAEELFWGAFRNSGQICIAIKRLFVHRSRYEELCAELLRVSKTIRIGYGKEPGVNLGPLATRPQYERVLGLMKAAKDAGANALFGSLDELPPRPGLFLYPTLVAGLSDSHPLVSEEQFGPILPIMVFDTLEEAISRANHSPMGLGASVWSSSFENARRVALALEAGYVWINESGQIAAGTPFGGTKLSGIGREGGSWGVDGMCEWQTIKSNFPFKNLA